MLKFLTKDKNIFHRSPIILFLFTLSPYSRILVIKQEISLLLKKWQASA